MPPRWRPGRWLQQIEACPTPHQVLYHFQQFSQHARRYSRANTGQNDRDPKADGAAVRQDWRVHRLIRPVAD
jgi:hypothetical protein